MITQNTRWPDIPYREFHMIVSDLDGTLKDVGAPLDPDLTGIIEALHQDGVYFTIATGKNLKSTRQTALSLGIKIPLVLTNGCMLQEIDGTIIEKKVLPPGFVALLIDICKEEKIDIAIHIGEDIYVREINHHVSILFEYGSPSLEEAGEWENVAKLLPNAHKCIAVDRENRQRLFALERKVFDQAGANVEYCHTINEMLEFMPKGVSKVSGIHSLSKRMGIPFHSIIAMGDGNNDIGMLQAAGCGVAVANAPGPVRAAVRWVIPPCADDGPKEFLRHILKMRQAA